MEIKNPILEFRELNDFCGYDFPNENDSSTLFVQGNFTNTKVDAFFVAQTLITRSREAVDTSEHS
ncbi:hypothetical protein [Chitinophaga costaii]|uniref:hypothetical protein n=1 Tax=Chitinophaga costaii TaxID=1335309 RepID=UPI000F4DDEAF|nr:hypothetical protein [Chitinophaga costaii]